MPQNKVVATMTVKFFKDSPPEIQMRDGIVEVPEELFSKTLEMVRAERNRVRVKVAGRQRREERLREQEELSNA